MSSTAAAQRRTKTPKSKRTATSIRRRRSKFIHVQRHRAACGPIAIANAIKWAGVETSYAKVLKFCKQVKAYSRWAGMWPYQMDYVLRTLTMRFECKEAFSIEEMDALIDSGGACILVYETKRGGHAVFIDSRNANGYRSWNRKQGMIPFFPRDEMAETLEFSTKKQGLFVYCFLKVEP